MRLPYGLRWIKTYETLVMQVLFLFLTNISIAINYAMRVNMSLAIVTMVQDMPEDEYVYSKCQRSEEKEPVHVSGPRYPWSATVEGQILGGYFIGYLFTMFPGAVLATIYSPKWVIWTAVTVNVVGCALTPVAAMADWRVLVFLRILQGLAAGVSFPATHAMISDWSPRRLLSIYTGIIYAGTAVGTIFSTLLTGYLSVLVGWENMFYVMSAICFPWVVAWAWIITDKPKPGTKGEDGTVDTKEDSREKMERFKKFPVKQVFTSLPFYACLIGHVGGNTGFYTLITEVPSFMKKVLYKDIVENTELSVIPYVCMFVVSNVVGVALDALRGKKIVTTTTARKIGVTISMLVPACCLVGLTFIGCNADLGIMWISIATGASGAQTSSYLSNHMDISPRYAGLLMGITNTPATIPGIVIPIIFGFLTNVDTSLEQWNIGFYLIVAVYLVSYIFFVIFASGEIQPWDNPGGTTDVAQD